MLLRRLASVSFPIALAAILTGCGTSDPKPSAATAAASPAKAASSTPIAADAVFNAGDVAFAQGMIPHHQQAVSMSEIALDPTRKASAAVTALATRIKGAQGPEIELMTSWLAAWNQPIMAGMAPGETMPAGATMPAMAGMKDEPMEGMMSSAEMDSLSKASGPEFDKAWLTMMVRHHNGAVTMSKTLQTSGKNADAKTLAGKIITAQMAEIDEMNKLVNG